MKRVCLAKKSHAAISIAGMITALILLSGVVWAEKDINKIDVKTDASSAVQQIPADQQIPDYLDPAQEMIQAQREMDRFGMPVDTVSVTADYKDGVLKITLPKVQADQAPQKITAK